MPNYKSTTKLADFSLKGRLGLLFSQARMFNDCNDKLLKILPDNLKALSLCAIKDDVATFVADNQATAFVAQQQQKILLDALRGIDGLPKIKKIVIKVDLKTV